MKIVKVVIPVAGWGTRLLPVTKSQPKEMLPVGRKPVVQYVVEECEAAQLKQFCFVTGRQKTSIEDHFDKDVDLVRKLHEAGKSEYLKELAYEETDAKFFFVRQSVQAGLADAIYSAKSFVGDETFVCCLGDSIIRSSARRNLMSRMLAHHKKHKPACTIAVEEVPRADTFRYGVVKTKKRLGTGAFSISDLVEKPDPNRAPSNLAIAARYIFEPSIFDAIDRTSPDESAEMQITDSIRILVKDKLPVHCLLLSGDEKRYDIGNFESYFKAFVDFAMKDDKYGYTLRQHLHKQLME